MNNRQLDMILGYLNEGTEVNKEEFLNETTYDKTKYHIDNGEEEKLVFKRFKTILNFLKNKNMLSKEGIQELQYGISEDTIINDSMLTKEGKKFLSKYYDKIIAEKDVAKACQKYYNEFKK
jgi:hypothetical protein